MSTHSPERVETIDVPGRWPFPVTRSHVVAAVIVLALALVFAGAWVIGGDGFFVASGLSLLVMIGTVPLIIVAPLVHRGRGHVRVARQGRTLSFPGTPAERPLYTVLAVICVLLPLTLRWDAARTGTHVSTMLLVWSSVAVPFGLHGLWWVARRYVRPRVELSTDGVRLVATDQDSAISWSDLPSLDGEDRRRLMKTLREMGVSPHAVVLVLSDPEVLSRLVELYRSRPDLRTELATGAALDRIRRGDFEARSI